MKDKLHTRKKYILDIFGKEPSTLDELGKCCIAVCNSARPAARSHRISQEVKVLGFAWDVNHGKVSNTHYCPVNGTTNWGANDSNKPTSYPGWYGRVWIRYQDEDGSDPLKMTLTYPGTGGSGIYAGPWREISNKWNVKYRRCIILDEKLPAIPEPKLYSWDFRFFDSDWPLIDEWAQKNETLNRIATNKEWKYNHKFSWMDEETKRDDEIFLQEF